MYIYIYVGGKMRDVRRVKAWRKDKLFFLLSLYAHWQICTKRRHFSFLLLGSIVLLSVICIYGYIQQRVFYICFRCIIFSYIFFVRIDGRTEKKEGRSIDDTSWFFSCSLLLYWWSLSDHRDRLFTRSYKNIFLSFPRWDIYAYNRRKNTLMSSI
jgi:hypothetical protein